MFCLDKVALSTVLAGIAVWPEAQRSNLLEYISSHADDVASELYNAIILATDSSAGLLVTMDEIDLLKEQIDMFLNALSSASALDAQDMTVMDNHPKTANSFKNPMCILVICVMFFLGLILGAIAMHFWLPNQAQSNMVPLEDRKCSCHNGFKAQRI